jgi:hypothetical protein
MRERNFVEMLLYHRSHPRVSGLKTDVYDGLLWELVYENLLGRLDPRHWALAMHTDGFPLFKVKNKEGKLKPFSVWPIMTTCLNFAPYYRTRVRSMFLSGLVSGYPHDLQPVLEIIGLEFKRLYEVGVKVTTWSLDLKRREEATIKAVLLYVSADYRGIQHWTLHTTHPKALACHQCMLMGHYVGLLNTTVYGQAFRFLPIDDPLRAEFKDRLPDDEQVFLELQKPAAPTHEKCCQWGKESEEYKGPESKHPKDRNGFTGVSVLAKLLPYWNIPRQCRNDPMHILMVVLKRLWGTLLNTGDYMFNDKRRELEIDRGCIETDLRQHVGVAGFHGRTLLHKTTMPTPPWVLLPSAQTAISNSIQKIRVPTGVVIRNPVTDLKYMKAADFIALLPFMPSLLHDHLPAEYYEAVCEYCCVLFMLSARSHTSESLRCLDTALPRAIARLELLFPLHINTITFHLLLHLVDGIRLLGPLYTWWSFPLERYGLMLKELCHSRKNPEASICNQALLAESVELYSFASHSRAWYDANRLSLALRMFNRDRDGNVLMTPIFLRNETTVRLRGKPEREVNLSSNEKAVVMSYWGEQSVRCTCFTALVYHRLYLNHIYLRSSTSSTKLKLDNATVKVYGEDNTFLVIRSFLVHRPSGDEDAPTHAFVRGEVLRVVSCEHVSDSCSIPIVQHTPAVRVVPISRIECVNCVLVPFNAPIAASASSSSSSASSASSSSSSSSLSSASSASSAHASATPSFSAVVLRKSF